jgi:hypothetical protein
MCRHTLDMSWNPGRVMGLIGVTALVLAGAFYVHLAFLSEHCFYFEGANTVVPAEASLQGKFCGEPGDRVSMVLGVFEAAAVFSLIWMVMSWQRSRDWVGKGVALLVVPAMMGVAWGVLVLPPDTCSEETAASMPTSACATEAK